MVVLDKTLKAPESPDPTWGIEPRKLTIQDFSFFIKMLAVTTVCAFIAFYPPFKEIKIVDGDASSIGLFLGIIAAIVAFFSFMGAIGRADNEANVIRQQKSEEWVGSVLRPYLEKKYGVRFANNNLLTSWSYPTCEHEGRTINVNIHGVELGWNEDLIPDLGHHTYKISPDGIWMEKVIIPEKVSFEPMNPVC